MNHINNISRRRKQNQEDAFFISSRICPGNVMYDRINIKRHVSVHGYALMLILLISHFSWIILTKF